MNPEEFMNLSIEEKLRVVNKMLKNEEKDHLKRVSERVGIPYSAFTKTMRNNGDYQYNQTSKKYEKLISLEEYEKYLHTATKKENESNETLDFIEKHLDELKQLLEVNQNQLILSPEVYDPSCSTTSKSFIVNADVYDQFTKLCSTHYPHLRQRDLVSQSLLDFVRRYQKTPSV